jgi:hypothetical protein
MACTLGGNCGKKVCVDQFESRAHRRSSFPLASRFFLPDKTAWSRLTGHGAVYYFCWERPHDRPKWSCSAAGGAETKAKKPLFAVVRTGRPFIVLIIRRIWGPAK